jgi:2-iminobutanoate/2-iminopropanoate deaminase
MTLRQALQPNGISKPAGVWSPAVVVTQPGKLVFLSGFTSRDSTGAIVGVGDIEAQTRQVCENLRTTVRAAGGDMKDIVSVTVFVRDVKQFDLIHKVRREFFPAEPPASTMVEVTGLVDDRLLIEINAIAALP